MISLIKIGTFNTCSIVNHNLFFRFNDDPTLRGGMSVTERVAEIAVNTFVVGFGVISFLAFPELTLIGFIAGHTFRHLVREGTGELWHTFTSVDLISKSIIGLFAFISWPYLYLMTPVLIGSYLGWSANERCTTDNSYLHIPAPAPIPLPTLTPIPIPVPTDT
ncbi:MAG: hypothetical protein K940chlam3_01097 [Chlamydiae bacterium]|nr:hypothetical protein [Chlamydiota bacterium]